MPKYGHLKVNYDGSWNGYMNFHVDFDISCVIDDSVQYMDCTISNMNSSYSYGYQSDGYGFINAGAICWSMPSSVSERMTIPPNEGAPEPLDPVWNQIVEAMPTLPGSAIFGVMMGDNYALGIARTFGGIYSRRFFLGGTLPTSMNLVNGMSRWYNWDGIPMPDRRAVIQTTNSYEINLSDINWRYRPWAIRKSGSWASCNRSGGALGIRKNGAFRTIENDEVYDTNDHAWIKKNGIWRKSAKL